MILQTARLILRPFAESDLDRISELMANEEFMKFSMGPMTRQQTATFLQKVILLNQAGLPSQFAVIERELQRVISLIHPDNHASRRVTEKNGMTIEKRTTFRGFPTIVFSINQESWQRQAELTAAARRTPPLADNSWPECAGRPRRDRTGCGAAGCPGQAGASTPPDRHRASPR